MNYQGEGWINLVHPYMNIQYLFCAVYGVLGQSQAIAYLS